MDDAVLDLLAFKVSKLPKLSKDILAIGACVGHSFDILTVSAVMESRLTSDHLDRNDLKSELLSLCFEGLVEVKEELGSQCTYSFCHDNFRQACLNQIAAGEDRDLMHLSIGRALKQRYSLVDEQSESINIFSLCKSNERRTFL